MIKKLQPFIDEFIRKLEKIEKETQDKQNDKDKEIISLQREKNLLREKELENNRVFSINMSKLDEEKLKFQNLQKELQNETSKFISMQSDLGRKIKDNDLLIEGNKGIRKMIEEELKKAQNKTKQYENKILLLQADDAKLNEKRKENYKQKELNDAKEKANLKAEQENIKKNEDLSARELDIKLSEKRIDFAKKQLKLDDE